MRIAMRGLLATLVWSLTMLPPAVSAKGGGHGGGHSSGHGSGHGGGGHGSSGHASRGAPHASAAVSRSQASSESSTSSGHTRTGQPIVGTAVPASAASASPIVAPTVIVPSRVGAFIGGGGSVWFFDPFWWGAPAMTYGLLPPVDVTDPSMLSPFATTGPSGGLRLTMSPKDAQVFVDGYYAGVVDDFDGAFQHVNLRVGPHHVQIRGLGFDPLDFDVYIVDRHTTTYRGTLTAR